MVLPGQGWALQAEAWSWSPLLHKAGSSPVTCLTNLKSSDSPSLNPNPSPRDRDENLSRLRPERWDWIESEPWAWNESESLAWVKFESETRGTRSRLPYESMSRRVSADDFGGKFDSAQLRFRFRFPLPQDLEQNDHGAQSAQTANLPNKIKIWL